MRFNWSVSCQLSLVPHLTLSDGVSLLHLQGHTHSVCVCVFCERELQTLDIYSMWVCVKQVMYVPVRDIFICMKEVFTLPEELNTWTELKDHLSERISSEVCFISLLKTYMTVKVFFPKTRISCTFRVD